LDNVNIYQKIDATIIDFSIHRAMESLGTNGPIDKIQNIIDDAINSSNNPIFLANFDRFDEFYNFKNVLVFTPEATYDKSNFLGIPRESVVDDDGITYDKNMLFSFMGAKFTHKIRETLINLYPHCCFDTVQWGRNNNDLTFRNTYVKTIKSSKFSLCPRGVGKTSYRLYESMMLGTVPVIISDNWKPPLNYLLNWDEFSVTIKENQLNNITDILSTYSDETIIKMSKKAQEVYFKYFNNINMFKCFYLYFKTFHLTF
jgi:hypothetical protein